jgi:hypothetical protein
MADTRMSEAEREAFLARSSRRCSGDPESKRCTADGANLV